MNARQALSREKIEKVKQLYHENDECMVSFLYYLISQENTKFTDEEITELLEWAGEDDVTPEEVRSGGVDC